MTKHRAAMKNFKAIMWIDLEDSETFINLQKGLDRLEVYISQ